MQRTKNDQALHEIETLSKVFGVDERLKDYYSRGDTLVIECNLRTAETTEYALMNAVPEVQELVQKIRDKEGALVYYVLCYGAIVFVLYVGKSPNMWGYQAPQIGSNLVYAAYCNLNAPKPRIQKGLVPMRNKDGALVYTSFWF